MKDKKHIRILVAVIAVVLVVAGIVTYSVVAQRKPATPETTTTVKSFWSDETFPDESTTDSKEHTLPMITVA